MRIVESLKPTGVDGVKLPGGSKSLGADGKIIEDQEGMEITPVNYFTNLFFFLFFLQTFI